MSFRDLISDAMDEISESIANEPIVINGRLVFGATSSATALSSGLSVQVAAEDSQVTIRTNDADSIGLAQGMSVEFRGKDRTVRDFSRDDWGWTIVELE